MGTKARVIPSRDSWGEWVRTHADERFVAAGGWFDIKAAERVRNFFRKFLRHSKGEWAGRPFELLPWQWRDVIGRLFGWMRPDGTRRFRRGYIEVPKKNGKALALDTPLPTPDGWTTMGDVKVGDRLFDERGLPCSVMSVSEVMVGRPCYEVAFSDGTSIVADAEHLWLTTTHQPFAQTSVRTTAEIAASVTYASGDDRDAGYNHTLPIPAALELPSLNRLPMDPYVLGVWLGDGHSAASQVTVGLHDLELVGHLAASGMECRVRAVRSNPGAMTVRLGGLRETCGRGHSSENRRNGVCRECVRLVERANRTGRPRPRRFAVPIQTRLRELGVLHDKHIPMIYLRAPLEQRQQLLQGLMDTDGYVSKAGQCEYTTVSRRLSEDVLELIRSLGLKATLTVGRAMLYGKDCGAKYRIQFWAFSDNPVARLRRKRARLKERPARRPRSLTRKIVAVRPIPSVPVRCVQIDSPSSLYLAGRGMVPTHNSSLFSGLGLYLLVGDKEPGAEVYSAAVDRDQASIVYNEAANMVEVSPELSSRLNVVRSTKRIVFHRTKSVYRALSADVPAKEGLNAHAVLIDELHAQKSRELWDTLRYAGASRRQPLHLSVTTAGFDRHSICWEQHEYAARVLDGTIDDPSFFGYIAAADVEDDWTSPDVWRKANPGFGITIGAEQFAEDCREAQESPAKENSFRRYRLNQWTEQDVRWLSMEKWDACGDDLADLDGRECFGGLDLSSTTDLSAFVLVFPRDGCYDVLPLFWAPEEGAKQRERRDRVPYLQWIRQGHIEATNGEVVDYDVIRARIKSLGERFHIREIAIDRWNATQLATQLEGDGFEMIAFGQGYASMNAPTKKLEELVIGGKLAHAGHPVLRWMAGNVAVEKDAADNWKPSKKKSRERIDGIVALVMAIDRATTQPAEPQCWYVPGNLSL